MRLVVFDCDGTLVDSQHSIVAATHSAFTAQGMSAPPRAQILAAVGLRIEAAMRRHAPEADAARIDALVADYRAAASALSGKDDRGQVMFDGMRTLLESLAQEEATLLAVVTMKSRRGIERVVDAYDIRALFQSLKSADDGPGKPQPDLLQAAMRECGVSPAKTLMVGDTSFDMIMAKAANTHAIGVGWGYQTLEELAESGADKIVDTPAELRDYLAAHASAHPE